MAAAICCCTTASAIGGGVDTSGSGAAGRCTDDADCSYNGVCRADHVCSCSPQWEGESCAKLRLLPASKQAGFHSPHIPGPEVNVSSWGGSILLDDETNTWHMYSAEMINDCGIGAWEPNSRVVHATSKTYQGPYTKQEVVVAPFAHEPNAVRSPDGDWVIYMTMRHPAGGAINCSAPQDSAAGAAGSETRRQPIESASTDSTGAPGLPEPRHTYSKPTLTPRADTRRNPQSLMLTRAFLSAVTHSKSPGGPWSTPVLVLKANYSIWDNNTVLIDTNLAVTIDASGAAVGIW